MIERLKQYNFREHWGNLDPKRMRRAMFYPVLGAVGGSLGSWLMVETVNLATIGIMYPLLSIVTPEAVNTSFLSAILDNPIRQMYIPEIPLFVGTVGVIYEAICALGEEYVGVEPDYTRFWFGRR